METTPENLHSVACLLVNKTDAEVKVKLCVLPGGIGYIFANETQSRVSSLLSTLPGGTQKDSCFFSAREPKGFKIQFDWQRMCLTSVSQSFSE